MNEYLNYVIYGYAVVLTIAFLFVLFSYIKVRRKKCDSPYEDNIFLEKSGGTRNDYQDSNRLSSDFLELNKENERLKIKISQLEKILEKVDAKDLGEESIINHSNSSDTLDVDEINEKQPSSPFSSVFKYYAGAFNNDGAAFYSVKDAPTEKTLFVLSASSKNDLEAEVEIYPDAIDKILGCKDLLDGVCDYSGSGSVLNVEKKGRAILKDNDWRIDQKMIIKFVEK